MPAGLALAVAIVLTQAQTAPERARASLSASISSRTSTQHNEGLVVIYDGDAPSLVALSAAWFPLDAPVGLAVDKSGALLVADDVDT